MYNSNKSQLLRRNGSSASCMTAQLSNYDGIGLQVMKRKERSFLDPVDFFIWQDVGGTDEGLVQDDWPRMTMTGKREGEWEKNATEAIN